MVAAVVFDLDGTLVDSRADIVACLTEALAECGHPTPAPGTIETLIGRPLAEVIAVCAPTGDVAMLAAGYRRRFALDGLARTRPFPGVQAQLARLVTAGVPLAVATTKTSAAARAVVDGTGLAAYFAHVQGTDGFAAKPAPDVVRHALMGLGLHDVDPSSCWMVGDTEADIAAGAAAGLRTAAVTHGTHDRARLLAAGADAVVDRFDELGALLA